MDRRHLAFWRFLAFTIGSADYRRRTGITYVHHELLRRSVYALHNVLFMELRRHVPLGVTSPVKSSARGS